MSGIEIKETAVRYAGLLMSEIQSQNPEMFSFVSEIKEN